MTREETLASPGFMSQLDFLRFRSVMRHASVHPERGVMQGVWIHGGRKRGLNMVATNGITMAFNHDAKAVVSDDFDARGILVIPNPNWHKQTSAGVINCYTDRLEFILDKGKIKSVLADEAYIKEVRFPNFYKVLELNPSDYTEGFNAYMQPEALKAFTPINPKGWHSQQVSWNEKADPNFQFWHKADDVDKVEGVLVTSKDPLWLGYIMPLDGTKMKLPNLDVVYRFFKTNRNNVLYDDSDDDTSLNRAYDDNVQD